jgi:hypothetical protein
MKGHDTRDLASEDAATRKKGVAFLQDVARAMLFTPSLRKRPAKNDNNISIDDAFSCFKTFAIVMDNFSGRYR